jgi:hypothetical protein
MRQYPRHRRQVGPVSLRLAKLCFRYDETRDAHVLRLVGNRFGPVLRSRPPIDRLAAQIDWSDSMADLAARRKAGRFVTDPQRPPSVSRDMVER